MNVPNLHPSVSAVPRTDPAVAAPASPSATEADRDAGTSRNAARTPVPSATRTTPSGPSSTAVDERQKALSDQEKQRKVAAEELQARKLARKIEKQGYDPRTADTPREIGRQIAANKFGWSGSQWNCYDNLIVSESNWDPHATNPTSGAYGIPQSLPGNKMATVASDWRTNPATQIIWGLTYVKQVYGTPCSAWQFKQGHNWY